SVERAKDEGVSGQTTTQQKDEIDYPKVIVELLSQAGNIQDLGKRFAGRYSGKAENHRLKVKDILTKMVKLDEIGAERTDFVKFIEDKPYVSHNTLVYFRKG
ncbi:hypothetical protein B1A_18954, partial [mine drainage metagenome]